MVRRNRCRETTMITADATVEEARGFVRKIVEHERGKCGGDVDVAIYRASSLYGVEEGTLRSLWLRCRPLKTVAAHIYLRLRQVDDWLEQKARSEREALQKTAEALERAGHPLAGVARRTAEMAGEED